MLVSHFNCYFCGTTHFLIFGGFFNEINFYQISRGWFSCYVQLYYFSYFTLPAVFLVSLFITGMQHGDVVAKHVSRGAVFGMTGVLCSILATWAMLYSTHEWLLSILVGFVVWFISAVIIFEIVEFISRLRRRKDGWKTERSNNQ